MKNIYSQIKQLGGFHKYIFMVLFFITCIVYLYQEPVLYGEKLTISDVRSQGIIFGNYRDNFIEKYDDYPLWYPYIFCGMPFHASGTYRLQYNLETIYKIIPDDILRRLSKGFTFNILAGAIFMLLLLRSYGLGYSASFAGAIAFAFTTKILGTPHTNRIVTFIHLPLILYALRRLWDTRKWIFMVLLGGVVGSQIGSYHPQVAYYGLLMIGLYSLYRLIQGIIEKETWARLMTTMGITGVSLAIGYYMASIVLIPMSEYLPYSIRGVGTSGSGGGLSYDYATSWSFDWWEIFTFIIPGFSGFGGNTYWGDMPFTSYPHYLGIPVVILAIIALCTKKDRGDYWFFVMVLIFSLSIAMGKNFSILSSLLLNYLPYFNKFREPSMILILFSLSTAVFCGWGFQSICDIIRNQSKPQWEKILIRIIIGFGVFTIFILFFNESLQNIMYKIYNSADQSTGRLQRFQNLQPAFELLSKGLAIETPSEIEKQGIIQSFEFTFELSWKTLKDYMESQGILAGFPREVIKQAFHHQIILDGELWLEMLGKRNLLAHTYDAKLAEEAYQLIAKKYFKPLKELVSWLDKQPPN